MTPLIPAEKSWTTQFCIGPKAPLRSGWVEQIAVGDVSVSLYPGASSTTVEDPSGQTIGVFVGMLIDIEAERVVSQPVTFDPPAALSAIDPAIEEFAYRYGGSWLLVIAVADGVRVYLDCDGSQSLVYDPDLGAAAATVGLLLDDAQYEQRFDRDLYDALGVAVEGWFPSGMTAHRGVHRLLCNHYLNMSDCSAHRHWPTDDFAWDVPAAEAARRVAEIVQATTAALRDHGTVVCALTGGNESRFLLAANRDICTELEYVTVSSPSTKRDVVLAQQLAEIAALDHQLLPAIEAPLAAQAAWHYRASHAVTGPNMVTFPSIEPLAEYGSFVGGLGGEIGRAFFWRSTDDETTPLNAEQVARRFGMPANDRVTEATQGWLDGLPKMNSLSVLDLAYLELRMSAWGFANSYSTTTVPHLHPMICREVYDLMLRMPPDAKRGNKLILEGVAELWPEIAAVPINRYGDYRDVVHTLQRVAKPHLVLKKLRKLFG